MKGQFRLLRDVCQRWHILEFRGPSLFSGTRGSTLPNAPQGDLAGFNFNGISRTSHVRANLVASVLVNFGMADTSERRLRN